MHRTAAARLDVLDDDICMRVERVVVARRGSGASVAWQVRHKHGTAAVSEAARWQGPDDVIQAGAMKHEDGGRARRERPSAGGRKDRIAVEAKLQGPSRISGRYAGPD